jgi:hypothetical protein
MSERETFLARWSRRKHAAVAEPGETRTVAASAEEKTEAKETGEGVASAARLHEDNTAPVARRPDVVPPLFDLASLPPIESIAADTDIRAFLAPGVPPELARAALRRAWAADPKVRDFVGLADYDWDFNAPGSMAGFGPLEMTEELRQIAALILGPRPTADLTTPSELYELLGQEDSSGQNAELVHDKSEPEQQVGAPTSERDRPLEAAQNQSDATEKSQLVVTPRHGGALPK